MGSKENPAAPPQPPPKRPLGKRKALAELPINAPNAGDGGSEPRATKPRTRAAARAEAEARKRREAEGVTRLPNPKRPDAGAAQAAVAPYIEAIDEYLRSLEVRVS
jgi:cyclin-A